MVVILLSANAEVDMPTHTGKTPLYKAASKGHHEVVRALFMRKLTLPASVLREKLLWRLQKKMRNDIRGGTAIIMPY